MLLRYALKANSLFSTASGLVLALGGPWLASVIGVGPAWLYRSIGVGLVLYGIGLWLNANRTEINLTEVRWALAMDWLWVIGSAAVVLLAPTINDAGVWIVGIVALVVADFAVVQGLGMRRLRKHPRRRVA